MFCRWALSNPGGVDGESYGSHAESWRPTVSSSGFEGCMHVLPPPRNLNTNWILEKHTVLISKLRCRIMPRLMSKSFGLVRLAGKTADANADADLLWEKNTIISLKRYVWSVQANMAFDDMHGRCPPCFLFSLMVFWTPFFLWWCMARYWLLWLLVVDFVEYS